MRDLSLSELRALNNSYMRVCEATARPTGYKFLSPEQAEELAKLSPSYKSNTIWGNTSNWICSVANRMIKFQNATFEDVYAKAYEAKPSIDLFEKFSNRLHTQIDSLKTYDDLVAVIEKAEEDNLLVDGLDKAVYKSDGRARQCLSLLTKGAQSGDIVLVHNDNNYIIGYPTNLEMNKKFSAIGEWCHTGSFGNAEQYYGDYAVEPIFYILNKKTGKVLCASHIGNGEVRDQADNQPTESKNNWNGFFTELGLKIPMVDNINSIIDDYEVPEDAIECGRDVYDRIDPYEIADTLFCGNDKVELEMSVYNRHDGNIYFNENIDCISPSSEGNDFKFNTRYANNVDTNHFYTFEEFKTLLAEQWSNIDAVRKLTFNLITSHPLFSMYWETDDTLPVSSYISIDDLFSIYSGHPVDFGYDYVRKSNRINTSISNLIKNYLSRFIDNAKDVFGSDHPVDLYGDRVRIGMDADKADSICNSVRNDTVPFEFEGEPDILSYFLKGKSSFAVERVNIEKQFSTEIQNRIAEIRHTLKMPLDLDGQQYFNFG